MPSFEVAVARRQGTWSVAIPSLGVALRCALLDEVADLACQSIAAALALPAAEVTVTLGPIFIDHDDPRAAHDLVDALRLTGIEARVAEDSVRRLQRPAGSFFA